MSAITGKVAGVYKQYEGTDKSKEIANFQSGEAWTASATELVTNDIINFRLGSQSIKLQDENDTGSFISMLLGSLTLNLAEFESTDVSNTEDYIFLIFFVNGLSYIDGGISLSFSTGSFDVNERFAYTMSSLVEGWNYVKVKKSAFTIVGTPNWNDIKSIRPTFTSNAGANTADAYVSFQSLYLLDDSKTYDFALVNNTAYTLEFLTLFFNWTADITVDVEDTTAFLADTVQWKEFTPTLNSFTMSIEKFWANGDFLDSIQSDLILIAYTDTVNGYRYDGLAKTTSDGITCEVGGIVNETLELQGSGELTYNEVQIIDV